jgi:hypothetical protein
MASPFKIFRKHQRAWLVALCVLVVIGFVLLPTISQIWESRTETVNPVVVRTSQFGDLRVSDLERLYRQRMAVVSVLDGISRALDRAGRDRRDVEQVIQALASPTQEVLVDTWLLTKHAERLGMTATDDAIREFLRELTREELDTADIRTAIDEARLSTRRFFDLMRNELLALRVQGMFLASLGGVTPAQRWDYFNRLTRLATVELASLPVEDFLDRVDPPRYDPDDADLQAKLREFYEQYKDQLPSPTSPEPGFREPHRIAIEYFRTSVDEMARTVTNAEVLAEYERDRATYDRLDAESAMPEGTLPPADELPDAAAPSFRLPTLPDEPLESDEPGGAAPGEAAPGEAAPADDAKDPTAPGEAAPAPMVPGDQSALPQGGVFRTVSFARQAEEAAESEAASEPPMADEPEAPSAEPPEQPDAPQPPEQPEPPPPPDAPMADQPAAPEADDVPEPPPLEPEVPAVPTVERPDQPDERPSAALRERIRRQLAARKVESTFKEFEGLLSRYRSAWIRYEVDKKRDPSLTPPSRPDFKQLAAEHNLTASRTPLLSQWEVSELDIGRSLVAWGPRPEDTFIGYAFDRMPLHQPTGSWDLQGHQYLSWKTEETKERTPEFTEPGVAERVFRAWKLVRAREEAFKEAEKLAEAARKAQTSLRRAFAETPGLTVVETEPFSWMTHGEVPRWASQAPPRVSQVKGVHLPGHDFMRAVFRLGEGEIGVAANQPQTEVFVVRVVEYDPPENVLWAQFEVERPDQYMDVAEAEQRETVRAWLEGLRARYKLEWEKRPEMLPEEDREE